MLYSVDIDDLEHRNKEKNERTPDCSLAATFDTDSDTDQTFQESGNTKDGKSDLKELANSTQPGLTVLGLYGKAPMPGLDLLPENYSEKDMKPEQFMPRRRLITKPLINYHQVIVDGEKEYDNAKFIPVHGLVNHNFWHIDMDSHYGLFEDRAILFQAKEHYDQLSKETQFSSCFDDYLTTPYFGEQVIVKGYDASQVAVGDVFEVEGGLSPLVVEVTSPRKPCYHCDKRNGTSLGSNGMKRHTLSEGTAGWFARVIVAGELRDGMKMVRTRHPNPKWTMKYLSKVLYGEGSKKSMLMCAPEWVRDKEELIELVNLPQLGEYEWKEAAWMMLHNIEKNEANKPSTFSFLWSKQNTPSPPVQLTIKGIYGRQEGETMEKLGLMQRVRYSQTPVGEPKEEGYEDTLFSKNRGLMWEKFWHADDDKVNGGKVHGDRAILFQAVQHYELLTNDRKFASCFVYEDEDDNGNDVVEKLDFMTYPTFGEQVIIDGCNSSQIAIGDVFEVEGGLSNLVIEISAPRKPGDRVDINHHGKSMGEDGIKQHCLTYGLAGWFTRVVIPGRLREGMKLVRTKHPHPKWTLSYISNALYGERDNAHWNESDEELVEMIKLPQLGNFQWEDEGKKLFQRMKTTDIKGMDDDDGNYGRSSSSSSYLSRFIEFTTGAS